MEVIYFNEGVKDMTRVTENLKVSTFFNASKIIM